MSVLSRLSLGGERERVPVNSNTVVSLVLYIYKHGIPFCRTNHRAWETIIHNQHTLAATQPCKVGLLQLHH